MRFVWVFPELSIVRTLLLVVLKVCFCGECERGECERGECERSEQNQRLDMCGVRLVWGGETAFFRRHPVGGKRPIDCVVVVSLPKFEKVLTTPPVQDQHSLLFASLRPALALSLARTRNRRSLS